MVLLAAFIRGAFGKTLLCHVGRFTNQPRIQQAMAPTGESAGPRGAERRRGGENIDSALLGRKTAVMFSRTSAVENL